jgi:hypothetical protein
MTWCVNSLRLDHAAAAALDVKLDKSVQQLQLLQDHLYTGELDGPY